MNQKIKKRGSKKIVWKIKIPKLKAVEIVDYLLLCTTILGSFLMPLTFSNKFEYPVVFPKYLLLIIYTLISTSLLVYKALITNRKSLIQSNIITAVSFFLLAYITASIFSPSPITSLIGKRGNPVLSVIAVICYTMSLVNITNALKNITFVKYLSWTLLASAVVVNISLILLIFSEGSLDLVKFYNVSPLGNINNHLLFNIFIIPILISLLDSIKKQTLKFTVFFITLLSILSLLLTQSLLVWIILAIVPIITILHSSLPKNIISFKSAYLLAIVLVLLIIPILNRDIVLNIGEHLSSILNLNYCLEVLKVFSNNLLFGTGPEILDQTVNNQFLNPALNTHLGGIYLKLIATTGIIGIITVFATLFVIIKNLIQHFKKFRSPLSGYIVSLIVFLVGAFFFIPSIPQTFLAVIALSVLTRFTSNNSALIKRKNVRVISLIILLAVSTVLLGLTLRYRSSEIYAYKAVINQNKSGESVIYNTKAIRRNSSHEELHIRQAKYLLNFLKQHPEFKNDREIVRQIRFSYSRAISLNPQNYENYLEAAKINYMLDSMYPNAGYAKITDQYLEKTLKLNPNSLEAVLIQSELNQNRSEGKPD